MLLGPSLIDMFVPQNTGWKQFCLRESKKKKKDTLLHFGLGQDCDGARRWFVGAVDGMKTGFQSYILYKEQRTTPNETPGNLWLR